MAILLKCDNANLVQTMEATAIIQEVLLPYSQGPIHTGYQMGLSLADWV